METNLLIPFDAYERNKKVSSFLKKGEKVLDVGGGVTGIKLFVDNPVKIVDLNVGDIKMDARTLKLPTGSYDVIVSVDVLEHIPDKDRKAFIKNLVSIAKRRVIISAPYGSDKHKEAEKKFFNNMRLKGKTDFFLEQHVKYGLPKPTAKNYGINKKLTLFYSGDFRVSNFLFWLSLLESGKGIIDRPLLFLKRLINTLLNIFAYSFWFYQKPKTFTNRFYLVVDK